MNHNIAQKSLKLILFLVLITLTSCKEDFSISSLEKKVFQIDIKGNKVQTNLAISNQTQTRGLSGIQDKDYPADQAMLFMYPKEGYRRFWMPDTYFNLDIVFLDKDFQIVAIEKNVPAHPGRDTPPEIYTTGTYYAKYVLETKASSKFFENLKVGDKLNWLSKTSLSQIEQGIRQKQ